MYIGGIFDDAELKDFFRKTNKEEQMLKQRQFLTTVTGGPQIYAGKSMKDAHKGRGIEEKEFNLVVEHVVNAFNELKVPQALQDETLALLGTTKADIVS